MQITNELISKIKRTVKGQALADEGKGYYYSTSGYNLSEFTEEEKEIFNKLQETIFYCFYGDTAEDWVDIISFESIDRLGLNRIGCASVTLNEVEYIVEVRDGIEDGSVIEFFEDDSEINKNRPLIEESISDRIGKLDPFRITPG